MRLVYLDNLRACLMTLGLVLHTCAAFSPSQYWIVSYYTSLPWVDTVNAFIHLFRMPLFYIISGYFAFLLLERQSIKSFVYTKLCRIAIPFICVLLLINWPQHVLIANLITSSTDWQVKSHSLVGHLWFLVNLLFYFLLYVLFHGFVVKLSKALNTDERPIQSLIGLSIISTPLIYLFILALNKFGIPLYKQIPIIGSLYSLLAYFDYFLFGVMLSVFGASKTLVCLKSLPGFAMLGIFACMSVCIYFFPSLNNSLSEAYFSHIQVIVLSLFILLLSSQLLNNSNKTMRRFSEASYSIYLFHHLFIVLLVLALNYLYLHVRLDINPNVLFILVILLSLGASICIHSTLVRRFACFSWSFNGQGLTKLKSK